MLKIYSNTSLGDYMRCIKGFPVYTREEEKQMFFSLKEKDYESEEYYKIKNEIINHNLKLVVSIAFSKTYNKKFDVEDLIQVGNEALINSIDSFDLSRNCKFSTYVFPRICVAMDNEIRDNIGRIIRLPQEIDFKFHQYLRLKEKLGLTDDEIDDKTIKGILNIDDEKLKLLKKIESCFFIKSLNQPINRPENDATLYEDIIEDENVEQPEEETIKNSLIDEIKKAMKEYGLTKQEQSVIIERFGLFGTNVKEPYEIFANHNISRQREHIVRKKALNKLSHSDVLKSYYV